MARKGADDLSDRTVIRPLPSRNDRESGPTAGSATVFDPNGGAWPAAEPSTPAETVFQPAFPVAPEAAAAGAGRQNASLPSSAGKAAPPRSGPAPVADDPVRYGSANAILSAAAPLLAILGRLRLRPGEEEASALAARMAAAIEAFEVKAMKADGVSQQDAEAAKSVLCEMADDTVGSLPGYPDWDRHSMLVRFFGSGNRGTGFFAALNQVLAAPEDRCDLLELMHTCLSLGFQGQYRGLKADQGALRRISGDAYETLRYFRPRPSPEISAHWQPSADARPQGRRAIPPWSLAAAAVAVVAASFFGLRAAVTADGDTAAAELLALNPMTPATIDRSEVVPVVEAAKVKPSPAPAPPEPAPPTRMDRVRTALDDDIKAGRLSIGSKGDFIVIEIDNRILFAPGSVKPAKEFEPVAAHIAAALDPEAGPVRIVGHTDSTKPGRSGAFKSNFDLSVARAKAVASLIAAHLKDASRLSAEGKGEDEPIADNATAEGRAKNRRIDVLIRRDAGATDEAASEP